MPESVAYADGFKAGVEEALRVVLDRYELKPARSPMQVMADQILGEGPAKPAVASKNRLARMQRDEGLLPEVVRLVQLGEVNKTIAAKLKIAEVVVKRVRSLAVARGWLGRHARR